MKAPNLVSHTCAYYILDMRHARVLRAVLLGYFAYMRLRMLLQINKFGSNARAFFSYFAAGSEVNRI